jgi:membrane fusion protein (multidrug efflux system)
MQAEKGYFVFVLDPESKAAMRPVQVGDWIGTDWVITAGLVAGDRVIIDNLLKLRPGSLVRAVAPAEAKPALSDPARPALTGPPQSATAK